MIKTRRVSLLRSPLFFLPAFILLSACQLHDELKAKKTTANMMQFGIILSSMGTNHYDQGILTRLAQEQSGIEETKDAWGHELILENVDLEDGSTATRIISLGKDGRRGGCCQKWITGWDSDAVLQVKDDQTEWLQVWR